MRLLSDIPGFRDGYRIIVDSDIYSIYWRSSGGGTMRLPRTTALQELRKCRNRMGSDGRGSLEELRLPYFVKLVPPVVSEFYLI